MQVKTLHTGDYTIEGFEDIVCVERKGCVSEIAMNLGKKKNAFQAEMQRMKDYQFSFLICEFDMDDILKYPEGSSMPKSLRDKVKVTGKYILKCLMEFQVYYDTKIMLCGNKNNAFLVCNSLFKRLNEAFHEK
jgi:ERCC4-type nuclease